MIEKLNSNNPYQVELFHYLESSFPYLFIDREEAIALIRSQAQSAEEAFQWTLNHGGNNMDAREAAHNALYDGLTFSPYDYLQLIVKVEFKKTFTEEQMMRLFFRTKRLIESYGPDIEGDEREMELVEELRQAVDIFISDESD